MLYKGCDEGWRLPFREPPGVPKAALCPIAARGALNEASRGIRHPQRPALDHALPIRTVNGA